MQTDIFDRALKATKFIPMNYWNGLAAVILVLLVIGIFNTFTSPVYSPGKDIDKTRSEEPKPNINAAKNVSVPPSIRGGNIFRFERKDNISRPPKPPPPPPEKAPPASPKVKLLGVIISDETRLVILDAKQPKKVKKEIRRDIAISGARGVANLGEDGKYYKEVFEGLESIYKQSYYEGENVQGFVIEKIYEDRIEIKNMVNGKRTVIKLEIKKEKEKEKGSKGGKSKPEASVKKEPEKKKPKFISGARSR